MTRNGRSRQRTRAAPTLPVLGSWFAANSRGFAREGLFEQGVYAPGGQPTLYDPVWTSQRVPDAVLRHEEVHQNLMQQTFHGVLTLILSEYGKVANASAAWTACLDEQWLVQELGATYAELAFVQRVDLEDFSALVNALPAAAKREAPYREAFDFANWLLPLDDDARHERFDPRTLVIGALCSCSMGTACLRDMARSPFDDARFASWIRSNSPRARLEQIGRAAGPQAFIDMTRVAANRMSSGPLTHGLVRELFDELSTTMLAHVHGLTTEPLSQLEAQANAAVDRLRKDCPAFEFDVARSLRPRGALFTDPQKKRELVEQRVTFDATTDIDAWLEACQTAGGLHLISGAPNPGDEPLVSLVCIPSVPGNPILDDFRVKLHPARFFACVKRFPGFPSVMTMVGDGWLYWTSLLSLLPDGDWVRRRVENAIRITVFRSLSSELMVKLLKQGGLYEGARCIVLEIEEGNHVALFDNPKVKGVYALQKIAFGPAVAEFQDFIERNGVKPIDHPRRVADFQLLYWIIQREFKTPD